MFEGAVVLALLIGIFKSLQFLGFGKKSKLEKLNEATEQLEREFYERLEEEARGSRIIELSSSVLP